MNKTNRIFFHDNPYPLGHTLEEFVWSARVDPERGLLFDFHLRTDSYYAEDDCDDEEEAESDWKSKTVWENYHNCILSSTEWHSGGIVMGTPENKFDFSKFNHETLTANKLPLGDNFDFQDLAFYIYLLGHDSCCDHEIVLNRNADNTFEISWTGKIARTYYGDYEFKQSFEANISKVKFDGIYFCYGLSEEENWKILQNCTVDPSIFRVSGEKFEVLNY
ncbi:hypothetical protein [Flavobacterium johnsoniae]|uniref:Uncharacterized protein n=1 Tax=Flavobacterium johnsoniae (strain ATCC 17061 / DSM 2064 / JCM 8514 / BCRC 14874 / CCUG 350202 / NBRC 14942 / NCIMB 11054 / UW101) TaxID=376686 RepID=A5FFT0_FLAJ1|nr:hypothetical protein [Flavobacterium johnsoniae]ABQ05932.1 hypothetical protein Fjoh_2911 [Flavobacterium johnsoniae UW101]OXE95503.1 hypothetical protein B0A63_24095 [Flavobacterium johnsoniae UW101]WQG81669.1 hypothetical protein SR927_00925 [Flavobacterium johnsoniae UW101]SHK60391.1 hypothetical protein SAMN05444146_1632 [Flavobacterium johnsoniae]